MASTNFGPVCEISASACPIPAKDWKEEQQRTVPEPEDLEPPMVAGVKLAAAKPSAACMVTSNACPTVCPIPAVNWKQEEKKQTDVAVQSEVCPIPAAVWRGQTSPDQGSVMPPVSYAVDARSPFGEGKAATKEPSEGSRRRSFDSHEVATRQVSGQSQSVRSSPEARRYTEDPLKVRSGPMDSVRERSRRNREGGMSPFRKDMRGGTPTLGKQSTAPSSTWGALESLCQAMDDAEVPIDQIDLTSLDEGSSSLAIKFEGMQMWHSPDVFAK